MIHIALSVYDPKGTYSRHAGVVIASVLRNTDDDVCFHILHDETLTDENRRRLEETAGTSPSKSFDKRHGKINFIDVSVSMEKCAGVDFDKICGRFSKGTLYRLMMPEIMPPEIDKLIYLDCDIVVTLDISLLWKYINENMKCSFAGVHEGRSHSLPKNVIDKTSVTTDKMGLSREYYINAGVLVMNLGSLRTERAEKAELFQRAVDYIDHFNPPLLDQDFLNAEYLGDILYLDPKYNFDPTDEIFDCIYTIEKIWHFGGHLKPWDALTGTNADMLYWKYLSLTPWKDELWESLFAAATNDKYYHRHSGGCVKRLKTQITEEIKNALKFRK